MNALVDESLLFDVRLDDLIEYSDGVERRRCCGNSCRNDAFYNYGLCLTCIEKEREAARSQRRLLGTPLKLRRDRASRSDADRARQRASYQKHHAKNLARFKRYRAENPEKMNEKDRRRRALKEGAQYDGHTARDVDARMAALGACCFYCGGPYEHVDHLFPLARGGSHTLANLVPACAACNESKGAMDPVEWLVKKSRLTS